MAQLTGYGANLPERRARERPARTVSRHRGSRSSRLSSRTMFVAQVVRQSMDSTIRSGAWCRFRVPLKSTHQDKIVLVQHRDATDPETGQRYTVKRYESQEAIQGDSWRHKRIILEPIVLTGAETAEVLGG